jgi:hypothetical protein
LLDVETLKGATMDTRPSALVTVGALLLAATTAGAVTVEHGVAGLKLILLDKYSLGKAKAVYVAKGDTGIEKGLGVANGSPPGLSGTVEIFPLGDPGNRAVYALPADWLVNSDRVAKYVNKTAAPGAAGAKVVVIKPQLVGKVVAKNLGDGDAASGDDGGTDLDLQALDETDTIRVVVTVDNANDGNTYVFCSDFDGLKVSRDGASQPFKVLSKSATAPASCSSTTTTTTSTCPPATALYCGVNGCGLIALCPSGMSCTEFDAGCTCVGDAIPCGDIVGGLSGNLCHWGTCPPGTTCTAIPRQDACGYDCGCQ